MAGGHGGGMDPLKEIGLFILLFIAMFIVWFFTGGPVRTDINKPFIKPASPIDTGETYGPNDFVNPKQVQ